MKEESNLNQQKTISGTDKLGKKSRLRLSFLSKSKSVRYLDILIRVVLSMIAILYLPRFLSDSFVDFGNFLKTASSQTIALIGLCAIGSVALLLMVYLQSDSNSKSVNEKGDKSYFNEIADLRYKVEQLKNGLGRGDETEKNISQIINDYLDFKISEDYIQNKIASNFTDEAVKNKRSNSILFYMEEKLKRIDDEIRRFRKNAHLNLVVGAVFTSIAMFFLGFEIFKNNITFSNGMSIFSHYIPRLSLVIFIQIFAFFFLKLYRANLYEIKYFTNEKTNIDFKIIALRASILYENEEMIKCCINNFINTERNSIIKKDESTVDLEKHKFDNQSNTDLKEIILGFLKSKQTSNN